MDRSGRLGVPDHSERGRDGFDAPTCRCGVRWAGHLRDGTSERAADSRSGQHVPSLARAGKRAAAQRRERAHRDLRITHPAPTAGHAEACIPVAGRVRLCIRRRAERHTDGQLHPQSGVPVWVGLGPALRDRGDMAASAAGNVGCRATGHSARDPKLGDSRRRVAGCSGESGSVGCFKSNGLGDVHGAEGPADSAAGSGGAARSRQQYRACADCVGTSRAMVAGGIWAAEPLSGFGKGADWPRDPDGRAHDRPAHGAPSARKGPVGQELWL